MSMRFTYPSHAANKKAETKSGGYAPKNRAAKPALRFRSRGIVARTKAQKQSPGGFHQRGHRCHCGRLQSRLHSGQLIKETGLEPDKQNAQSGRQSELYSKVP